MTRRKMRRDGVKRATPGKSMKLWGPIVERYLADAAAGTSDVYDLLSVLIETANRQAQACEGTEQPPGDWRRLATMGHAVRQALASADDSISRAATMFGVVKRGGWADA
ncbi:hypothetical protein [Enhydrobacter sp.]|jgi:hypothetical protein|uniref:hypothetical protein n=1 Tax=Enhydrobacter sp. TaxID=1894999 RepID=UPI00261CED13|nr:hypothetical protein [Enhydrobacter sp.]WIM10048.1 MAG: hypothetical protein OJF58_001001 [Enhydrobacter sp.]